MQETTDPSGRTVSQASEAAQSVLRPESNTPTVPVALQSGVNPILHALHEREISPAKLGIVVVDHGSRIEESNALLLDVVNLFRRTWEFTNVEPAHMELARPTIADAFRRCRERGAEYIAVCPFFLARGRHWSQDIPYLAEQAAVLNGGIPHLVCPPLGLHPLMVELMAVRIAEGLRP